MTLRQTRKRRGAKTIRTCQQLLKVEPALWTFVTIDRVEPTNNAAVRALLKPSSGAKIVLAGTVPRAVCLYPGC
jgi:hypothetical protein